MGTEPKYNVFQSLPPKQENNKEYWDDKTHTSYEKEKNTQQEG